MNLSNNWRWKRIRKPWRAVKDTTAVYAMGVWCNHLYLGTRNLIGGGGHGDPLTRDSEAVAWDVRNDRVSVEAAREQYGVVVDRDSFVVNTDATSQLRKSTSATTNAASPPERDDHIAHRTVEK